MSTDDILDDAPTKTWTRPTERDVLTADEVAALLRVDRKTVYDASGRGDIPCRRIGKRILFSREAIMLWLEGKAASRGE
jgi:excisionase family DNA binding protein